MGNAGLEGRKWKVGDEVYIQQESLSFEKGEEWRKYKVKAIYPQFLEMEDRFNLRIFLTPFKLYELVRDKNIRMA